MASIWEDEPEEADDLPISKRKARQQVTKIQEENYGGEGDYNIWYHKSQKRPDPKKKRATRCSIATDAGTTMSTQQSEICVFFAQGCCATGHRYVRAPAFQRHAVVQSCEDGDRDCERRT